MVIIEVIRRPRIIMKKMAKFLSPIHLIEGPIEENKLGFKAKLAKFATQRPK